MWASIILGRRTPTLWKGSSLVIVNTVFVVLSVAWMVTRRPVAADTGIILFDLFLIVTALILSRSWVVFGIDQQESVAILERCVKQTRSTASVRGAQLVIQCGDCEMTAAISPNRGIGSGLTRLPGQRVLFGPVTSKKAVLLRSLFCKQFASSLPTPRIRA